MNILPVPRTGPSIAHSKTLPQSSLNLLLYFVRNTHTKFVGAKLETMFFSNSKIVILPELNSAVKKRSKVLFISLRMGDKVKKVLSEMD